jgi:hypothetical protein
MAHRAAEDVDFELDEIWLYIAKQSGSGDIATSVVESITNCFVTIGRNPKIGRSAMRIYSLEEGDASMLHVIQGNRDIESLFGPLRNALRPYLNSAISASSAIVF